MGDDREHAEVVGLDSRGHVIQWDDETGSLFTGPSLSEYLRLQAEAQHERAVAVIGCHTGE